MRNINETLLYRWFDEVWNNGDENAIDRLMSDDSTAFGIVAGDPPKGAAGFKIFFNDFRDQFQDIRVQVEDVISQDDVETARTTVSAKHRESGKDVSFSGMCMVKIAEAKLRKRGIIMTSWTCTGNWDRNSARQVNT